MTVSTSVSRVEYAGDGTTTVFTVPFYFLANGDLKVYQAGVLKTLTTHYSVAGAGVEAGGTVTFVTAPASGDDVVIFRDVAILQQTDYPPNDPFPAASHERALDKLTMIAQRNRGLLDRAFVLPDGLTDDVDVTLPAPESNKLIGWNPTADALQNVDPTTLATVVAFGTANADTFTGDGVLTAFTLSANPGAQANLDVSIGGVTQVPTTDYTWSAGTTLTFTAAPPNGAVILVRYMQGLPQGTTDSAASTFIQAGAGAVTRVVQDKLRETVSVKDFGGVGDGVADDTVAIAAALASSPRVDMRNGTWKWTSTIDLPAGTVIDARGSTMVPATGANPCMKFDGAKSDLMILGGTWAPTSGTFLLRLEGSTDTPTLASQYARQIRLLDMHISTSALTAAIDMQQAVRQVYIDRCMIFCPSGINASGKTVEVMVANSIIYSATSAAGTYGIKLRSTGGGAAYNEGWSFSGCTIDAFENTFDVADIFVLQVVNSYVASIAAGYAFLFQAPTTTTHTQELNIGNGCVIAGRVRFAASGAGRAYNCKINGAIFNGVPGVTVAIENNAANITVSDCKFKGGSSSPQGVVGTNNNANIICSNLDFDSTYTNGVVLNGAAGTDCVIGPLFGPTTGDMFGAGRAVLLRGNLAHNAATASYAMAFNPADLVGAYIVGAAISTQAVTFVRGERGWIVVQLYCSGMNAATQRLDIATPAGMVLPSGAGWAANFIYPSAAGAIVSARIPYYCTADGTGNISITNGAGNTVTLNSHCYFGMERHW